MDNNSSDKLNSDVSSVSSDSDVEDLDNSGGNNSKSGGIRTYNGSGIGNRVARGFDRANSGVNNLSHNFNNMANKFNKFSDRHGDSKVGKSAGTIGDKLNNAGNKIGNAGNRLGKVNKGVQTANNVKNVAKDSRVAADIAKQVAKDKIKTGAKKVTGFIAKNVITFLVSNPVGWIILIVLVVLLIIFVIFSACYFVVSGSDFGDSAVVTCETISSVDNICSSITVKEYGTMSLDDYVAGVINAEVGGMIDDDFNMYKAGAVAARSYVLANAEKGSNDTCVVTSGEGFQVYKSNPSNDMINAAKETSGVVMVKDGNVYSTQYDAFCFDSKNSTTYNICQGNGTTTSIPSSWVEENVPSVYYNNEPHGRGTHGNGMSQYGAYYLITEKNWSYIEVLNYFYGDSGAVLASANGSSSACSNNVNDVNGNFQPFSDYNLKHAGSKPLDSKLTTSQVDTLNNYINSEVDKAGYGTGAGVAAAGQSLVHGLEQLGYYLRYKYGARNVSLGVDPNWYGYNTMDCSAFVSWAIKNGCNSSFGMDTSAGFNDTKYGPHVDIKDAKPGDIMVTNGSGHVRLVVKNNGDGSVITAEETSSNGGLVFTNHKAEGNYHFTDMSSYYSKFCKNKR